MSVDLPASANGTPTRGAPGQHVARKRSTDLTRPPRRQLSRRAFRFVVVNVRLKHHPFKQVLPERRKAKVQKSTPSMPATFERCAGKPRGQATGCSPTAVTNGNRRGHACKEHQTTPAMSTRRLSTNSCAGIVHVRPASHMHEATTAHETRNAQPCTHIPSDHQLVRKRGR